MKCEICGFDLDKYEPFSDESINHGRQGHYERFTITQDENKK